MARASGAKAINCRVGHSSTTQEGSQNTQVKAVCSTATGRQPRQRSGSTSSQRCIKQGERTMTSYPPIAEHGLSWCQRRLCHDCVRVA